MSIAFRLAKLFSEYPVLIRICLVNPISHFLIAVAIAYRYNGAGEIGKMLSRQRDREVSVFVRNSGFKPNAHLTEQACWQSDGVTGTISRAVVNSGEPVVETYDYYPFGLLMKSVMDFIPEVTQRKMAIL